MSVIPCSFPSPIPFFGRSRRRAIGRLQLLHQHLAPRRELHEARGFQRFVALVAEPLRQVLRAASQPGGRGQETTREKIEMLVTLVTVSVIS
jgi:hypothetical protein